MAEIDARRLLDDLHALRAFGATGNGVVRTSFSDVDMEARRWLRERMASAGLQASIDGVGNVVGRSMGSLRHRPQNGEALGRDLQVMLAKQIGGVDVRLRRHDLIIYQISDHV